MTFPTDGYGADTGAYGGYGDNYLGYGDQISAVSLSVSTADGEPLPDDGGVQVEVVAAAPLPHAGPYSVQIGPALAYAGIPGQGRRVYADAGLLRLQCVAPPLPAGTYSVTVSDGLGWSCVCSTMLVVVVRRYVSTLYEMRQLLPPQRSTGALRVEEEPA